MYAKNKTDSSNKKLVSFQEKGNNIPSSVHARFVCNYIFLQNVLNEDNCWGYEAECDDKHRMVTPVCPGEARGW